MSKNCLLLGATGLIGAACRQHAQSGDGSLRILARRRAVDAAPAEDWRLYDDLSATPNAVFAEVDVVLCALGTTHKAAGSAAAFAAVDRDLVLQLAAQAQRCGVRQWIQVSALGAHPRALSHYSRVKGQTDTELAQLGFARLDILHPSLLLGERHERRPAEAIGQRLAPLLNPLLPGSLRKYRAVPATRVAQRMLELATAGEPGVYRHHFAP